MITPHTHSNFPLSIVFIGIGDGPWERMQWLDDHMEQFGSKHDNFQFVKYNDYHGSNVTVNDESLALAALQEIPDQYDVCVFV